MDYRLIVQIANGVDVLQWITDSVRIANGVDVLPTHSTNSEWCGCATDS